MKNNDLYAQQDYSKQMKGFDILLSSLFLFCSSWTFGQQKTQGVTDNLKLANSLVRSDFQKYFDDCAGKGSIAIYDQQNAQWILSDTAAVHRASLPASTFKIINLLIALETNTIKDEHTIIQWPGSIDTLKYGFRPDIYRDISVKEAFELSAGWAFIEIAKKIDRKVYQHYLSACHYGNADLSETDPDFWNFGALALSPINQINLLKKLYEGKLPFSQRNMDLVKRVMITGQQGSFTEHGKTGWTMVNQQNTGWWVGYLEGPKGVYFFATQLLQDRALKRSDFGNCRKEITKKTFKALNILE